MDSWLASLDMRRGCLDTLVTLMFVCSVIVKGFHLDEVSAHKMSLKMTECMTAVLMGSARKLD